MTTLPGAFNHQIRIPDEFSGLMAVRRLSERLNWRGYFATPAGSPLETVVNAFRTHTNLPLDLAYHTFLFYLSAHLLQRGTTFNLAGMKMTPEIWTVILAPSGSGKTFSAKRIGSSAPTQATFPECASGARFIEAMEQNEEAGKDQATRTGGRGPAASACRIRVGRARDGNLPAHWISETLMSKEAKRTADGLAPYTRGAAVTKSDATVLEVTQALYVGGAGNVNVTMADGGDVLFTAVPVGTILPIQVTKVLSTSTTATAMVALYN